MRESQLTVCGPKLPSREYHDLMSHPWYPHPMPPYQPNSPNTARIAKPRNRVAAIALISALLAGLAAALSIGFAVASHATTSGCIVDNRLDGAAGLCAVIGGLLGIGAVVTGLISLINPGRARGAHLGMGIAAMVIGAIGGIVCLAMFVVPFGSGVSPQYLHPC